MTSRWLRWAVLCFAALWFNVVVPVHTRGQIKLPGAAPGHAHACCATSAAHDTNGHRPHCPDPGSDSRGPCAVCFFMAALDTPPPVTVIVHRGEYVEDARIVVPTLPHLPRTALPLSNRGPPAA